MQPYSSSSSSRSGPAPDVRRVNFTLGTWVEDEDPFTSWWKNRDDLLTLAYAVGMGGLVATSVFIFDVSIQYVHDLPDIFAQLHVGGGRATGLVIGDTAIPFRCVMPIGAGFVVAYLQGWGFSPALKFLTRAIEGVVDDTKNAALPTSYWQVFRRALASVITLGSGASLGPEAPSVELGANTAAVFAPKHLSKRRQRMLVAAGAAAGVSAAFDAPATGALFAIEFVLKSSRLGLDRLSTSTVFASTSVAAGVIGFLRSQGQALGITGAATHLVGRIPYFSVNPNLLTDVLQFSVLGVGCAGAAVLLYEGVRVSEVVLRPLPRWVSAPLGGAVCGLIAFKFPQVQYGYINLEEIFRDSTRLSAVDLSSLLLAKIAATSVCVGGGLVGGLFAPSLFIGALVGDVMGHFVANRWGVADPTTLVVVGAAAVLGAACRAPLTAFGLMVEITRDTGLFVPLLASIGVASLVSEYAEGIFSEKLEAALSSIYLKEKLLFWGAGSDSPSPAMAAAAAAGGSPAAGESAGTALSSRAGSPGLGAGMVAMAVKQQPQQQKTVEAVIATPARLYVRHTLPLEQAKDALIARASQAAVVVDDSFTPLGIVYLDDIEAELVKQELLAEPDANFDRPAR
ncbi:hypothetical protein OEZ86_001836 [Tetradesmus obliquus]|nr:hypothetical protein OEZ86_001836 [Tetradesmus obliquus]